MGIIKFEYCVDFIEKYFKKFNNFLKPIFHEYFKLFFRNIDIIKEKQKKADKIKKKKQNRDKRKKIKDKLESKGITEFKEIEACYLDEYYNQIVKQDNIDYINNNSESTTQSIPKREIVDKEEVNTNPKWKQVKNQSNKRPSIPIKKVNLSKNNDKTTKKSGPLQPNGTGKQKVKKLPAAIVKTKYELEPLREDPMEKFNLISSSNIDFKGKVPLQMSHNDWNKSLIEKNILNINNINIFEHSHNKYLYDAHGNTWTKGDNCIRNIVLDIVKYFEDPSNLSLFIMTGIGNGFLRKELASWTKMHQTKYANYNLLTSKVYDDHGADRLDMVVINITSLHI